MASRQKNTKKKGIGDFYKKLIKRYPDDPVVLSRDRKILEHLVFAVFLENASFAQARDAFAAMEEYFIDWNEIRVSKAREIADVVPNLPDATNVGERLRRLLQWVFDETYKFDLEDMRAKGSDEVYEFLKTVPYSTAFMNDYVSFFCFGVGGVPLDEGELRVLRLLGFVAVSEDQREIVAGLEEEALDESRFFFALHELGAELIDESKRAAALKFLRLFDKAVDERSDAPLVKPSSPTDPREIARLVAKQEKRQKRVSTPTPDDMDEMDEYDDSDDSDSAGGSEDFDGDFDDNFGGGDDSQGKTPREGVRRNAAGFGVKCGNAEASLTKNGASYTAGSGVAPVSSKEEPLDKKSAGKSSKKTRGVDKTPTFFDGELDQKDVASVPTKKRASVGGIVDFGADTESRFVKSNRNVADDVDASVCKTADEKGEIKRRGPVKKATTKKEKNGKNDAALDDALKTDEPIAKPKSKARVVKSESGADAKSVVKTKKIASKTKEIEQKKPR